MPAVPAASTRNSSCDTISTICLSSQPQAPTSSLMLTDSAPTKRDKKNKLKTIYLVSLVIPLSPYPASATFMWEKKNWNTYHLKNFAASLAETMATDVTRNLDSTLCVWNRSLQKVNAKKIDKMGPHWEKLLQLQAFNSFPHALANKCSHKPFSFQCLPLLFWWNGR
jgi:hypothetical protein